MTVLEQINIAKISQFLSANDKAAGVLFGARLDPQLPVTLYMERVAVEYLYNLENPTVYTTTYPIGIDTTDNLLINSIDQLIT